MRRLRRLCAGYLLTAVLPQSVDSSTAPWWIDRYLEKRPWWVESIEERMRLVLGQLVGPELDLRQQAMTYCLRQCESAWGHWRALHRSGWRIETTVEGLEHLRSALDQGHGAVLWGLSFGGDLAPKIALHGAGVDLIHLSSVDHGAHYPVTRLGAKVVGPFHCVAENRYLTERIIIPADDSLGYMRLLLDRLEHNRSVWITGERQAPRGNESATLFGRDVRFATGAPALCWQQRSPLLPTYTVRLDRGSYRCHIGPPVTAIRDEGKAVFVREAVLQFAARLEGAVLAHPSDWSWEAHTIGWYSNSQPG